MRVVTSAAEIKGSIEFPVMAIGVFDGVHIGHQQILRRIVRRAKEVKGNAVVLSFSPHPQKIIASGKVPRLLQTFTQQAEILESIGVDVLVRHPFTRALSLKTAEEFVRSVLLAFNVREVHVGANFRFGHQREGSFETLRDLGKSLGFAVHPTEQVFFRGDRVSSTRIRNAIGMGQMAVVRRLIGRPYEIRGDVVKGAGNGAKLGFPTANLKAENELLPPNGVYITRVRVGRQLYFGATNIGFRPTVRGYTEAEPTIETFIHEFSGNLYGQSIQLEFLQRIRDEKEFATLEELTRQIRMDIRWLNRYVERTRPFLKER